MEMSDRIKKIVLSLDGSESFIIKKLKEQITANPEELEFAAYQDSKGEKYELSSDNKVNKTDVLKSVEFSYHKCGDYSPYGFELRNLNTSNIKIDDTIDVSYELAIFDNKEVIYLHKIVEFFILVNDVHTIKIIGTICIGKSNTIIYTSDLLNKMCSVVLADRYAFAGYKFKVNNDHISMKIDYVPGFNIDNMCSEFIKLLEDTLEEYYAPLRKLAK